MGGKRNKLQGQIFSFIICFLFVENVNAALIENSIDSHKNRS